MTDDELSPEIITERAALIGWKLGRGERLSTHQVALMCSLSPQGAWALLGRMARILPIRLNEQGEWQDCSAEPGNCLPTSTGC